MEKRSALAPINQSRNSYIRQRTFGMYWTRRGEHLSSKYSRCRSCRAALITGGHQLTLELRLASDNGVLSFRLKHFSRSVPWQYRTRLVSFLNLSSLSCQNERRPDRCHLWIRLEVNVIKLGKFVLKAYLHVLTSKVHNKAETLKHSRPTPQRIQSILGLTSGFRSTWP